MTILELSDVCYTYDPGTPMAHEALSHIDLKIEKGSTTGLIGHTGCGKSTLLRMLNGLSKPDSGKILLDGHDIWEDPKKIAAVRFRVGLVMQYPEYQLFDETVASDIAYGPRNMGLSTEEITARVKEPGTSWTARPFSPLSRRCPWRTSCWKSRRLSCRAGRSAAPQSRA